MCWCDLCIWSKIDESLLNVDLLPVTGNLQYQEYWLRQGADMMLVVLELEWKLMYETLHFAYLTTNQLEIVCLYVSVRTIALENHPQ